MKKMLKLFPIIAVLALLPSINAVTTSSEAAAMNEIMPGTVETKQEEPSSWDTFWSNFGPFCAWDYWFGGY